MEKINLLCLPFAGGNRYSYRDYEAYLPQGLQLVSLEYPGRGARIQENFITDMMALVDDVFLQARPFMQGPYALYGHSMGGVTAFYLLRKILAEGMPLPLHLFITGTMGPGAASREKKKRHLLNREDFIAELKVLDGCPEEILQNEEMLQYVEPIIRADFQVSENFRYTPSAPLDIGVTVITGTEEDMEPADIATWQQETLQEVDFRKLPGNHFFILDHPDIIVSIIAEKILQNIQNPIL